MLRVTSRYRSYARGFECHRPMFTVVIVTVQADRYDGSPSYPAGVIPIALPPRPNSLFKRGVITDAVARFSYVELSRDCRCCSGNHLREPPCILSQASQGISRHGFRSSNA